MKRVSIGSFLRLRIVAPFVLVAIALSLTPLMGAFAAGSSTSPLTHVASQPLARTSHPFITGSVQPPSDASCRAKTGFPCYSPQEIRNAYDVTSLIKQGDTGKGQTIAIIDSFGSPTIRNDLNVFDKAYGLPNPPSLKVLAPLGTVPFNPKNADQNGWAFETTLDVEWAHALAPGANIVLLTSPVSETQGVQGLPEFLFLEQYAVAQLHVNIISQSWGTTENTLFTQAGRYTLNQFENFYKYAAQKHVTVLASAGDNGTANPDVNGKIYPFPTVGFPASSPYVTAVGGTSLYASTTGSYQHETVWDEVARGGGATGGGISEYFAEPYYQYATLPSSDQKLLNGHRGLPDISYNADPYTSILVYLSFAPNTPGFYAIGGTSEGSPQWAGIVADGNQLAGHPLGFLNPALYKVGSGSDRGEGYHDITVGNNGYDGIKGYNATPGWDAATGWGTPKTASLMQELAALSN
jgi:subtilase family serine protease